jgi:hypothetical protein
MLRIGGIFMDLKFLNPHINALFGDNDTDQTSRDRASRTFFYPKVIKKYL